jgi:hypothetical protein
VLDTFIADPPELGQLDLPDEALNRRAEAFGVTELSLGWLRAWGRRFPSLPEHLLDVVLDPARHLDRPRDGAAAPTTPLLGALRPAVLAAHRLMFAGRLDGDWLARTRASARVCATMAVPLDVLSGQIPVRMLGLRDFGLDAGASGGEVATLLTAAVAYEQFRLALLTDGYLAAHPVVSLVGDAPPPRLLASA